MFIDECQVEITEGSDGHVLGFVDEKDLAIETKK